MYHRKVSLFVSIKLVPLFHEDPPDGTWGLSLKRGENAFRQSWKYNMFEQIFFQLVFWFISKMTIHRHISSFADLLMFKTPRAIHPSLHGKLFAWYTYEKFVFLCAFCSPLFFSKWYHCTSFKLDLLFVSYKLCLSRF